MESTAKITMACSEKFYLAQRQRQAAVITIVLYSHIVKVMS